MAAKTAPSTAIHKSVVSDSKTKRNEIFVDIVERVSVTFSSSVLLMLFFCVLKRARVIHLNQ
jgi:hypothetical protein